MTSRDGRRTKGVQGGKEKEDWMLQNLQAALQSMDEVDETFKERIREERRRRERSGPAREVRVMGWCLAVCVSGLSGLASVVTGVGYQDSVEGGFNGGERFDPDREDVEGGLTGGRGLDPDREDDQTS